MITLKHNDKVKLASWGSSYAVMHTDRGYMAENGKHQDNIGDVVAIYTGSTITNSQAFYDKQDEVYKSAVVLTDGETVTVEGMAFRVKVMPRNGGAFPTNNDPIHFITA